LGIWRGFTMPYFCAIPALHKFALQL